MTEYRDMRHFSFEHGSMTPKVIEERDRRYNSPAAIRLPFQVGKHPAFVMLNLRLHAQIASIYRKNTALNKLCATIPGEALRQFAFAAMVEEIQQTNEVENVRSTRKEIHAAVRAVEENQKDLRFSGMVRKYRMLINETDIPLESCADIRKLYDEFILDEVIRENPENVPDGVFFRKGPNGVYDGHDRLIHEGLQPEGKIIQVMEQGLAMLREEDIDPLIRIAAFHYLFAYIHPFYDGNGRMTRFICSYLLSKDFNESACMRISFCIKEEKTKYYRLFKDANENRNMGDLTSFVMSFLEFFDKALEDTHQILSEKQARYLHYHRTLTYHMNHTLKLSDIRHQALLVSMMQAELFGNSFYSIKYIATLLGCSKPTAQKFLDQCGNLLCHTGKKTYLWHVSLEALDAIARDAEIDS